MNRYISCFLVLVCAAVFGSVAFGQDEEDVVKITSQLVQVDAVVTDKKGAQVTDLTANDFQILQDGKRQEITGFSYVPLGNNSPQKQQTGQLISSGTLRRTGRGRVITFVVDDGNCRASSSGIRASREALQKFLNEQMLPDDMVAIYQTRAGSSMFQQYTSDKTALQRVVGRLRWYPNASGCPVGDGSYFDAARVNTAAIPSANGVKAINEESADEKARRELTEDRNRDNQVLGTLGVLRYALRGLERLPGRKVMILMSDGMPYQSRSGEMLDAIFYFRDLTEQANRAAVVINAFDIRGSINPDIIEARDDVSTLGDPLASDQLVNDRRREQINTQNGLVFLANETGGKFYHNQDYLDKPLANALSIERGYYLIAYEPDADTFKGKKFNKIEIRVTRPELSVQTRTGFIGVTDQPVKTTAKTGDSELYEAIVAPLPTAGLDMALTAYFGNTTEEGNFIRSSLHLSGSDITFTDEAGGLKKAVVDVVAVTMDDKNKVIDEFTHSHTFKVPAAAVPTIEKNGLLYSADVKVQKPGVYNFRVALRDVNSKRIGSASQVIEVPDLKQKRLFVSGLVATQVDANGKFVTLQKTEPSAAFAIPTSAGVASIRQFHRGSVIAYPYNVFNAKVAEGGKPNLTVEANLYFDGKLLIDGKPLPADLQPQTDWTRISDFGYLKLNPNMPVGDYVLEIIVRDAARGKDAMSSQTTDFQVVN